MILFLTLTYSNSRVSHGTHATFCNFLQCCVQFGVSNPTVGSTANRHVYIYIIFKVQGAWCAGLMVLRFNINPPVTSCSLGCSVNTSRVAEAVETLVNSFSFNLSDISSQTLYVDQLPAFYSWSGQSNSNSSNKLSNIFTDNNVNNKVTARKHSKNSNFCEGLCRDFTMLN